MVEITIAVRNGPSTFGRKPGVGIYDGGGRLQLMYCVVHKDRQSMLLIGRWMCYTVSFILYLYCLTQVVFTADNCIKTSLFL